MVYKILIQPAKTERSICKNCKENIDKNSLRLRVVDAKDFNEYIRQEGVQNISGEGLSRGYFECAGPNGQTISIKKYFVHLECYQPIEPHPFEKNFFELKGFKKQHREIFNQWLEKKRNEEKQSSENVQKSKSNKTKQTSKRTGRAKSSKAPKTKKIEKGRRQVKNKKGRQKKKVR